MPGPEVQGNPSHEVNPRRTGTVKEWESKKGFGFIQPSDGTSDVFVHISAVQSAGLESRFTFTNGMIIEFETQKGRGKASATNLSIPENN